MEGCYAVFELRCDGLHFGQSLDTALCLGGLGRLGLEAVDKHLNAPALLVLLLLQLQFQALFFAPSFLEIVIAARVKRKRSTLQVEDAIDGAVEEVAVVTDNENSMRVGA